MYIYRVREAFNDAVAGIAARTQPEAIREAVAEFGWMRQATRATRVPLDEHLAMMFLGDPVPADWIPTGAVVGMLAGQPSVTATAREWAAFYTERLGRNANIVTADIMWIMEG